MNPLFVRSSHFDDEKVNIRLKRKKVRLILVQWNDILIALFLKQCFSYLNHKMSSTIASAVRSTYPLSKEYIWKQKKMIRYGAGTGKISGDEISCGKLNMKGE